MLHIFSKSIAFQDGAKYLNFKPVQDLVNFVQ